MTAIEAARESLNRQAKMKNNPIIEGDTFEEEKEEASDVVVEERIEGKTIPIVTQNAKEYDLNHFKQFCKVSEFCKREKLKVHDKTKRPKDKGSKDHGLVYVAFNGGLFLAMKMKMKYSKQKDSF